MQLIICIISLLFLYSIIRIIYNNILRRVRELKLEKANYFLSTIKNDVSKKDIDSLFGFKGHWVADVYSPYKGRDNFYDTYSSYIWKENGLVFSFLFCNDKLYSKNVIMKGKCKYGV